MSKRCNKGGIKNPGETTTKGYKRQNYIAESRYVGVNGNASLPQPLSRDLSIRFESENKMS